MDWLPISAAALLSGATALVIGAQLVPRPDGDGVLLRHGAEQPDTWIALSILLSLAAVGLIIGMPSLFVLFQPKGFRTGLVGTFAISVGAVMLAGFAQTLVVIRALALDGALSEQVVDSIAQDDLFRGMLTFGFAAFYVGELLLALALARARTTPWWVPWLFVAHVVIAPLQRFLPEGSRGISVVLMAAAFAGAGIAATRGVGAVPRRGAARVRPR